MLLRCRRTAAAAAAAADGGGGAAAGGAAAAGGGAAAAGGGGGGGGGVAANILPTTSRLPANSYQALYHQRECRERRLHESLLLCLGTGEATNRCNAIYRCHRVPCGGHRGGVGVGEDHEAQL
jgi:hypothetical protein